ncbi:MAG: peptidoglycan DD-metalloendopeptidase family protein [Bacteroidales bacterium]|nr:peptidoglycan DD-metalloendopeptidase family protein [Bacteroidales bacterium]
MTIKKLITYIIFLVFLSCLPLGATAQNRQSLEKEKSKLEKEIASMNAILNETRKNKKMSTSELQIIRKKVEQRQQLVKNISSQIGMLDSQIKTTQQTISESYRDLEVMKQNYASMLRYAQKNKSAMDKLLFVFSAKDYKEAYQRYVFFRKSLQMQRQQMYKIQNKTLELSTMTQDLLDKKQTQSVLLKQEQVNTANLNKEKKEQEKVVQDIKKQETKLAKQIKEKEAKKKKLQNQINAAVAEEVKKQAKIAETKKKNASSTTAQAKTENKTSTANKTTKTTENKSYVMSATPKEEALSNSFAANKGKLPWPVAKGVIVSGFGRHPHPDIAGVEIENLGVDIRTTKGSSVKAVFEGEVCKVWTGPNGNKIVIIRHGEYMTVYTNLASVSVADGNKVSTGQTIGTIASNENGQSEMNFQVRQGVKCQNPVLWLSR